MGYKDWVKALKDVSIHVPARGTTQRAWHILHVIQCFNPRSREGNDYIEEILPNDTVVSIHVPARGTTMQAVVQHLHAAEVSIHVPARGTTPNRRICFGTLRKFQSTFPRGERRQPGFLSGFDNTRFNPRSREGNDQRLNGRYQITS